MERKPEITYLDAIRLRTSFGLVLPVSCDMNDNPRQEIQPWCEADGENLVLKQGEYIDLWFDLPENFHPQKITLEGLGYYLPLH